MSAAPHDGQLPPQMVPAVSDDAFINDQDAVDSAGDDDDDEDKPKSDKKAGRRKIKIEFIQDKSRRHITFSKRKAGMLHTRYSRSPSSLFPFPGIMKKVIVLPISFAPANNLLRLFLILFLGLRIIDAHWYPSPFARRVRDRARIHLYHCEIAAPRHPTRGQESYPSLSQCPPRNAAVVDARRCPSGPPVRRSHAPAPHCASQQPARWSVHRQPTRSQGRWRR